MHASGNWLRTKSREYKKSTIVTDQHITYFNIVHSSTHRYRTWPHPFISSEQNFYAVYICPMLARTSNFSRFITSDIPNTQTKVTLLITEARAIEASFDTTGIYFYGTQNGDSQKRLCIHILLYFFFGEFCDIRKHNKTSQP
jgi:hypothetical protein